MRARRLVLLAVVAASVGAACAPLKKGPPSGVVLWGDSFAQQVAPLLPYEPRVYPGTAPCGWLPQMRERAASRPPAVAVLLFAGSTAQPCTGGTLDGYPRDTHEAIRVLSAAGTRVVVVAAPCLKSGPNPVNTVYTDGGVPLAWGPHDSVCPGGEYDAAYRESDQHLNSTGAARFAQEIRAVAG
jgi:hypothetical protein